MGKLLANFLFVVVLCLLVSVSVSRSGDGQNGQNRKVIKLDSEGDVSVALAQYTADLSEKYIKEKGYFTVVLSGGTLIDTLRTLAGPYNYTVDWGKWYVFWVDERVVPLNSDDSNYKLANEGFFKKVQKIPKDNIFAINYSPSSEAVAKDYENRLKTLAKKKIIPLGTCNNCSIRYPVFDLMLLGIGPDGHLASLFPNRQQRYVTNTWVTFINDSPKPPPKRITLTFPVIKIATNIAMVVTGSDLADAVNKTLGHSGKDSPITSAELNRDAEGELTWFLDKDAASKLSCSD